MIDIPVWVFLGYQMRRMRWIYYVVYMGEKCMDCFGLG